VPYRRRDQGEERQVTTAQKLQPSAAIRAPRCDGCKHLWYSAPGGDRLITPAEYKAIHAKLSPRNQCVMDLCFLTGQRVGDILSLKRAQLQADGIHFVQQKTGAKLIVGWTPELREVVARAKTLTGTVVRQTLLSSRDGGPPQYSHVWRAFNAAATAAGVADFRIHDLRALAATTADAEGISAQKLLGHKSARTTESYLRDKRVPVVKGPRQA
jgi:integrase